MTNFKGQLAALGGPTDIQELDQAYRTNAAIRSLVDSFGVSAESAALYSGDNTMFITAIYKNVLNRAPEPSGLAYWVGALDNGSLTRANAAISIMAGALANATEQGKLDGDLVNRKITVGSDFTDALIKAPMNGYDGKTAATQARAMLTGITATTDIASFQTSIAALVGNLADAQISSRTPVANAGAAQNVVAGTSVTLDGSASLGGANAGMLTYKWTLTAKPAGSIAMLTSPTSVKSTFRADVAGAYVGTLIVNDGNISSAAVTVAITVIATIPVADSGKYTCSTISHALALELFSQGHTYLDRDHDGKPCEATDISLEVTTPINAVKQCYVNGYFRKNGTYVHGYYRRC